MSDEEPPKEEPTPTLLEGEPFTCRVCALESKRFVIAPGEFSDPDLCTSCYRKKKGK